MSSNIDEAIDEFNYMSTIILTVFGMIGNSISIYILSRPKLREISVFRYLIVSIVNDYFVLITMLICNFQ